MEWGFKCPEEYKVDKLQAMCKKVIYETNMALNIFGKYSAKIG